LATYRAVGAGAARAAATGTRSSAAAVTHFVVCVVDSLVVWDGLFVGGCLYRDVVAV
jgi:hypothetical protein